jgi:hypothetical protein
MKSLKTISRSVTNRPALLLSGLASQAFASVESKADALLAQMTLDEKIGQMAQVDLAARSLFFHLGLD